MPKAKCLSHGEFGAILIELSYLGSAHCLSIATINPRIRGEMHCRGEARTHTLRRIKRGLLRIYKRTRVGVPGPGADNAGRNGIRRMQFHLLRVVKLSMRQYLRAFTTFILNSRESVGS